MEMIRAGDLSFRKSAVHHYQVCSINGERFSEVQFKNGRFHIIWDDGRMARRMDYHDVYCNIL
ncbi:MAG: hypothetical protein HRT89_21650 [Lentisphaeria bacterium]|nr:hypothetical protein [Lentisphaeria bacterium]NQZ70667.1 hypothetical protein [Lentisphaeria bacterium]